MDTPICETCGLLQSTVTDTGRCGLKREPHDNEPCSHRERAFTDALARKADVVIPGLERVGPLSAAEVLATRDWFERERRTPDK